MRRVQLQSRQRRKRRGESGVGGSVADEEESKMATPKRLKLRISLARDKPTPKETAATEAAPLESEVRSAKKAVKKRRLWTPF
jgi:ribosomal protein L44E